MIYLSESCLNAQNTTITSGSGVALTVDGYFATNFHVIDKGIEYYIDVFTNGVKKTYTAKVIKTDIENDLAVLKIIDTNFKYPKSIPYSFKMQGVNVGEKVFAMGFPIPGAQGEEVKVTDGIISSKTGYQNDNKTYQISAPIQPGNSGGPLFDESGNLVGLNSSGIPDAENVGYAIKISYLNNLLDLIPELKPANIEYSLIKLTLPEKIKILSNYTVLIRVVTPNCDISKFNMLYEQIKEDYSYEMICNLLAMDGELYSKTEQTNSYKWQVCGISSSEIILATYYNGELSNISKFMDNRSNCLDLNKEFCNSLKIGTTYEELISLIGFKGDNKMLSFQNGIKMFVWYDCNSSKILLITFDKSNKSINITCN